MRLNDIKTIAKYYIYFSENPKESTDKLKLIEFVDKANEQQINYLLLKGVSLEKEDILLKEVSVNMKITSLILGKTPEEIRRIVSIAQRTQNADLILDLYKTGMIRTGTVAGGVIAAASIVALLVWIITKFYRVKLSQAAKTCRQYSGDEKKQCIKKFNINALKAKISLLQKSKSVCSKTKDPEKCKTRIQRHIEKVNKKIQEI